ncbi:MAG: DUF362 domain-containing protein [Candidatus Aminicenantales bacterium]
MKRREFLKNIAAGSFILKLDSSFLAPEEKAPDLVIVEGEPPAKITKEAVSLLGGMKNFISRGEKILIKPNIGWDRTPEQGACTNPEVVKALVELSFEAGARQVKVMDNPCNQAKRTYVRSGIASAAKQAGAKVPFASDYRLKKIQLNGEWLKEWLVYTDFLEADKIINVPIAKTHSLSRVTLGMKNWLGALGGNRNQLHQKLDQAMVDLAAFFKPCLTVLDAYRVLVRNGPQGGRLSDVELHKTVIAGIDYVAVDAAGTSFFRISPQDLPFLRLAHERGHGEIDLKKLRLEKRTI